MVQMGYKTLCNYLMFNILRRSSHKSKKSGMARWVSSRHSLCSRGRDALPHAMPVQCRPSSASGPFRREAHGLALRHLDESESLPGAHQQRAVRLTDDFEGTPEAGARNFIQAAADEQPVAEFRRALVVHLRASDHGENASFRHRPQVHAHERGETRAASFDHPQVGKIVDDAAAVGVEKHDFLAGFESRNALVHGQG